MARPLIATNLFNICKKIKRRILIALRPPYFLGDFVFLLCRP